MDKLALNLTDLEVDSFQTNPDQENEQGTVHGYEREAPLTLHVACTAVTCEATCTCGPYPA